jgi:hypothetical protein
MAQTLSEPLASSEYKTFSPRLAPTLSMFGGLLAIAGGLGVWVRALEMTPAGTQVRTGSITGFNHAWGWVIAVLGVVAIAVATRWNDRRVWRAAAPIAVAAALATLIGLRLSWAGDVAGRLAFGAGTHAGSAFTTYHAGFGWGAWLLALAAVASVLGVAAGVMRALDVRRGLS